MSILFHDSIYGPVKSRRFGYSLGINLLPSQSKLCTFNCIYCECGWNPEHISGKVAEKKELMEALEETLISIQQSGTPLDVLTYAGNGEPTLHPNFLEIAESVSKLRDLYASGKKIVLLTNGTTVQKPDIKKALSFIDVPVFKLDSANEQTMQTINLPNITLNLNEYIDTLSKLSHQIALQTMFLKGRYHDVFIDNTTEQELSLLIEAYRKIHPWYVLIYSLDRLPPVSTLEKIDMDLMKSIAQKIESAGIKVKWV